MEMNNWLDFYTNDKETDEFFRTYNTEYWNKRIYTEDGRYKKSVEIAKEMLIDNLPIDKITKYTNLSKEEIVKLKEANTQS